MDIKARLSQTEQTIKGIGEKLQELDQNKQLLMQELLRQDGEHRLLLELQKEVNV